MLRINLRKCFATTTNMSDAILQRFLLHSSFKIQIKKSLKCTQSAIIIQRYFRYRLFLESRSLYIKYEAARLIQRNWRIYVHRKTVIRRILSHYELDELPEELREKFKQALPQAQTSQVFRLGKVKKVLVEMEPPGKDIEKLSPEELKERTKQRNENLKWAYNNLAVDLVSRAFNDGENRKRLRKLNEEYLKRKVKKTFFTVIDRSFECFGGEWMYLHRSSLTVYLVNRQEIERILLKDEDEVASFKLPWDLSIVDSAMDRLSGRIFCLLNNWSLCVFENGFFSNPIRLSIPKAALTQKFLFCDKYGYLWFYIAVKSTCYLLDPLYFSVISEIKMSTAVKPRQIFPIYREGILTRIIASDRNSSNLFQCSATGQIEGQLPIAGLNTSQFVINKKYVVQWNSSSKLSLYERSGEELTFKYQYSFAAVPVSVAIMNVFSLLVVAFHNSTIEFFRLTNEEYGIDLPRSKLDYELEPYYDDIIGYPRTTVSGEIYSKVGRLRTVHPITAVSVMEYLDGLDY